MTIIQKAVVCALGTGNVLFSGTKEPVKIVAFKGNHKKELKHFKGRSLCTGFLACEFTGILSDIAFGQEFADLKINNCLDKTNIYCAAGILILYVTKIIIAKTTDSTAHKIEGIAIIQKLSDGPVINSLALLTV